MSPLFEVHRTPKPYNSNLLTGSLTGILAAFLLFFAPDFARADDTIDILFVSSQTSAPYLHFIEQAKLEFQTGDTFPVKTTSLPASQLTNGSMARTDHSYDIVIALGTQATRAIQRWQPKIPVLYALIPKTTYDSLRESGKLACPGGQCTAIYIDQPLQRLFHILDAAFGEQRRLGVLLGPTSLQQQDTLVELAGETNFSLHIAQIHEQDELLPALNHVLKQSDLLFSIADPVVYNRRTAKSILLTTYRYKVPVVAYSKAYADAGAALSVFSTPEQIARQAATIIKSFFKNNKPALPLPQYPEHYKIRINQHVANSLGLDLESNPELQSIIKVANDE